MGFPIGVGVRGALVRITLALSSVFCIWILVTGSGSLSLVSRCLLPATWLAPGARCQVPGTRYQVPGARHQAPGTRHQVPGTRHLVAAAHQVPGTWYQVPGSQPGMHDIPRVPVHRPLGCPMLPYAQWLHSASLRLAAKSSRV